MEKNLTNEAMNLRKNIKKVINYRNGLQFDMEEMEDNEYLSKDEKDYYEWLENEMKATDDDINALCRKYKEMTGREFRWDFKDEIAA